ncbi:MAG: hypothetical protein IPN17_14925 [Deltaproteobacteria bacterium]|nr:hypothetical protein [Deltaproteobacteria bacterium]
MLAPTSDTVYYVNPSTQTITTAISISAGENHSCSVFANGQVWCWGGNAYQEFGINNTLPSQTSLAQRALGITDAVTVSGAFRTVCALRADGTAQCWGANSTGTVGNAGTATTVNSPENVRDTTGGSGTRLPSIVRIVSGLRVDLRHAVGRHRDVLGRQHVRPVGRQHEHRTLLSSSGLHLAVEDI